MENTTKIRQIPENRRYLAFIERKKGTVSSRNGSFLFERILFRSQKRFAQRLRAGVVVDFGEHLRIAVAQEPRRHIGVHPLDDPKGGPGMAQLVRRKYGNVWMEFVECPHERAVYPIFPVVGLSLRTVEDLLHPYRALPRNFGPGGLTQPPFVSRLAREIFTPARLVLFGKKLYLEKRIVSYQAFRPG